MKNLSNAKWICLSIKRKLLLILCLIVGSALQATSGDISYAQVKTLTIKAENKTFKDVFAEIESKSEFVFLYYDNLINHEQKVFIDVKNQTIDRILEKLFAGTNLSYEIDDRQIIITQKNTPPVSPAVKAAEEIKQANKIKGKVVDENGDPMPGVTAVVVGSTRGVLTDVDGSFEIEVKSTDKIKFTFLGYKDHTITVGSQKEVFIKMETKVDELAEVQVVAFGKQKKESVIGSISTVSVDNLKKPVGKLSTSLAGQLAGIVGVQRSGEPGAGADFWIRGISTFGNGGSPLVLVDGVERSMDLVDPEDIESFSILKDATATAVYGVRGANGIILITTRRGKEGKIQINAKVEYGITSPVRTPKLASAGQWIDYYNDISMESSGNRAYSEEDKMRYLTGYDPDLYPNVDWVEEIFKKSTDLQRVNFNVSGGSQILRYYVAGSLYFENGIFNAQKGKSYNPTLNYKRYNFRSNFDVNLTSSTVLSVNLVEGVNLEMAGKAIMDAMKKANSESTWVAQAWQANPRPAMIDNLNKGDLLILDLFSDCRPMWGPKWSLWYREQGYGKHEWVYCMLLNFGGRTGLYGKMEHVINGYYDAQSHRSGQTLQGVGTTMEAIENNPVMYELLYELPWRNQRFEKDTWLKEYTKSRYGKSDSTIDEARQILSNTVYAAPKESVQEGTTESVFAACPQLDITKVSCCSATHPFYNTDSVKLAADRMLSVADQYKGNNNFEYDLIDVVRQTIANKAYYLQKDVTKAFNENKKAEFKRLKDDFLTLILVQDSLLETRPEFMVGSWINQAKKIGKTEDEKKLYEWNARTQITVWGSRISAETGLNDYAYKEWSGILKDYYCARWNAFFNYLEAKMDGENPKEIDFYTISEKWTNERNLYPDKAQSDPVDRAKHLYYKYISNK